MLLRVLEGKKYETYMKEHIFPPPLSMHQCALQTSCFNRMRVTLQVVSVSSSDLCSNRFKRNLPSPLQDSVDCRAYYPSDAHSSKRNHSLVTNPLGSSCLSYQSTHDIQINGTGPLMYNRMKGCTRSRLCRIRDRCTIENIGQG